MPTRSNNSLDQSRTKCDVPFQLYVGIVQAMPKATASDAKLLFAQMLAATRQWYGKSTGRPNLNMEEFAIDLGIEGERYRHYERGGREPPIWLLADIRRLTGISLDLLIANTPPGLRFNPAEFPLAPRKKRRVGQKASQKK